MATAKYGFFFFLLSKLLAIKGLPQDSVQLSGSNGITDAWVQSPQGMQNDMNSYYSYPAGASYNTMYDSQSPLNYAPQVSPTYYTPMQESLEDSTYGANGDQYQPTGYQPRDYDEFLNEYQTPDPIINSLPSELQSSTQASQPYHPPTQSRSEYAYPASPMAAIQDQMSNGQPTFMGDSNSNYGNDYQNIPAQASSTSPQPSQFPMSPMQTIQDQLSKNPYQSLFTEDSNLNNGYNNQNNPTQVPSMINIQPLQPSMTNSQPLQPSMTNAQPLQPSMTNSQLLQPSMTPMEAIDDQLTKSSQSFQSQVQPNPGLKPLNQMLANGNNEEKKLEPYSSPTSFFKSPVSNPFSQINSPQDSTDSTNKPSTSLPPSSFITNQNLMPSYNDYLADNFFKTEPQGDSMNDPSLNPLPDSGNTKSGLETQLDSFFSSPPPASSTGPQNKNGTPKKANGKLENIELDESVILNDLAKYEKSFNVDVESTKSGKEDHSDILTYANPNDIYLPKLPPVQSSGTIETNVPNNINSLNKSPTSNPVPNYNATPNSNQLLSSLFNFNLNKMFSNQMPSAIPNNNYSNSFGTNVDQKQMASKDNNPPRSNADKNGYIYKQVDLMDSPQYTSSWSLLKSDYNLDNNRINGNPPINTPEIPSQFNQYYNQDASIPSLNNMSVQNMMFTVSNGIYVPSGATKVIFDVTRANFPRIPVIQQIQLTYVITKAIALGLRAISNSKSNKSFSGQRVVKPDINSFTPATSFVLPKFTIERDCNFPVSGTLLKKDFQLNITPTTKNKDNNRPLTTDTVIQQMKNSGINLNKKLQDNDYLQQAKNTPTSYYTDLLATEIKNAIYSNLPDAYTPDSFEVNEYVRQMILAVGIVYQDQINDVLQGPSPIMNIY